MTHTTKQLKKSQTEPSKQSHKQGTMLSDYLASVGPEKASQLLLESAARVKGMLKDEKVFLAERQARSDEEAKQKGKLNSGFDAELMQAGFTLAGFHIEAGARNFKDFAAAMIEDMGDGIIPYLESFYNGVKTYPDFDSEGMTSYAEVEEEFKEIKAGVMVHLKKSGTTRQRLQALSAMKISPACRKKLQEARELDLILRRRQEKK
jgi:hypothetical protein